ncbi:uncharacterized protein LOC119085948 [Bradysia coprophila]|uniref:uncharacterized protein LOC119085948 n=1 Tax=Bradysia coprophila TaxID=38358 RepID=UPI00187DC712|nr:uncharacterized protein LOC119085948 [Bradysia coprophila]
MLRICFKNAIIIVLILQCSISKGEDQFSKPDLAPSTNDSVEQPSQPLFSSPEPVMSNRNIVNICDNNLWKIACSVYERTASTELLVSHSMFCFGSSSFSYSSTTLNTMCESIKESTNMYNNYLWIGSCAVYKETSSSQLLVAHTMSAFRLNSFSYDSITLNAICDANGPSPVTSANICDTTWTTACAIHQRTFDARPLVSYAMRAFNLGSFSYNENTLNIMCKSGIFEHLNENCHNSWKVACALYEETNNSNVLVSHIMSTYQLNSFSHSENTLKTICNSIIETIETNAAVPVKRMTFCLLTMVVLLPLFLMREYIG